METTGQSRAAKRKQKQRLKKKQKEAAIKQSKVAGKRRRAEDSGAEKEPLLNSGGQKELAEETSKKRHTKDLKRDNAVLLEVDDEGANSRGNIIEELLRPFLEAPDAEEEDEDTYDDEELRTNSDYDDDDEKHKSSDGSVNSEEEVNSGTRAEAKDKLCQGLDAADEKIDTNREETMPQVPEDPTSADINESSPKERARAILQWMLGPVAVESFFRDHWEQRPLLIRRKGVQNYYSAALRDLECLDSVREIVNTNYMVHGKDLDVTMFHAQSGVRKTLVPKHNRDSASKWTKSKQNSADQNAEEDTKPEIAVDPDFVWRNFRKGCSVRLRCPQQHSDDCWRFLSALEDAFGSMIGANLYVTPGSHQGFAPHYDDIEAFILQLSGRKKWRVYRPLDGEDLPRFPSSDFSKDDMARRIGRPVLETVLEPGDLLFFPRGFIHQAETESGTPSIHLTISAGQHNAFIDFCEFAIPEALAAAASHPQGRILRDGLPCDWLSYFGAMHSERPTMEKASDWEQRRKELKSKLQDCMQLVAEHLLNMLDPAADQFALKYLSDRLQPAIPQRTAIRSAVESPKEPLTPLTLLRIVRPDIARLAVEEGKIVLYHCMENARTYRGAPLQSLEFEMDDGPAIEKLLFSWPEPVQVSKLPHPNGDMQDKLELAKSLYQESLLEIVGEASPYASLSTT